MAPNYVIADERIYLTADKQRAVGQGQPGAHTLYAAPGHRIPLDAAARLGIGSDGRVAQKGRKSTPDNKERKGPADDKSGNGPGASGDLTQIKGIGKATAAALAAAGIGDLAALAAADPATPPDTGSAISANDWVSWVDAAKSLAAANQA